jgi:hypothetical protein
MDTDPFIHETIIVDADGWSWTVRQTIGIGTAGMGEEVGTSVQFTNAQTGEILRGRVSGLVPVQTDELLISLNEARRRHRV